jgi:hypothetical protein
MTGHDAYRCTREDRLATLLEDPESWRFIAAHALDVRDLHQFGTPAWSALTRLHHVALELTRLADEPQQRQTA